MGISVALSSKGQLVIPASVRDTLGLSAGDVLDVSIDAAHSTIVLAPVPTLAELSARVTALAMRSGASPVLDVHEYYRTHRNESAPDSTRDG